MRFIVKLLLLAASLLPAGAFAADKITIAAAADLKFCMDELVTSFKQAHADTQVDVTYGSSGNFATQIRQGAPFDLYFSADVEYPRALAKDGLTAGDVHIYALGRIVLWSATLDASKLSLQDLTRADIQKIAIANPQHAPYGKRAEEALRASGVWDKVQDKLVLGENIAQAAQFAQSGSAQVGIIALSLALNAELASKGKYALVPSTLHQPLQQAFTLTQRAADNASAHAFADYIQTPAARAVMVRYGFALPGDESGSR